MVGSCATVLGQVVRVVKTLLIQSSLKRGSGQSLPRDQMEQSFASLPIRLKPHKMDYGPVCEDNCVAWNSRVRKLCNRRLRMQSTPFVASYDYQ